MSVAAPIVEVRGLCKQFEPPPAPLRRLLGRPREPVVRALDGVDLEIRRGEILGLVGRNGAGKTVLLKLLATLSEPTSGTLRVFGHDSVAGGREIRQRVGMATCDERSFYWRLTSRQNLMFFARLLGFDGARATRRTEELFELLDLREIRDRPYRVLSSGNRQRLAIARALLHDPELLLLDEPTNSLDPIAAQRLRALIADRIQPLGDRAILVTSHNLEEVQDLSSRIAVLDHGKVLETADLATLRARYGSAETVTVRIAAPLSVYSFGELVALVPGLRSRPSDNGVCRLAFEREPGDDRLHTVMKELTRRGARIVGCETKVKDLQAIFDTLVGTQEAPDA